jgi:DNA-binding FadR family transcriptional regulator
MTELAGLAAKLAASRMPPELRGLLVKSFELSHEFTSDAVRYDQEDNVFHDLICRGTCNTYLEQKINSYRSRIHIYSRFLFQSPGRIQKSLADHGVIVSAILNGDGSSARDAMQLHLFTGGNVFADIVTTMPRNYN